ncbi:hypothetical protein EIK77_000076 [Talaromyces pinophilus]|nr:hypothetical protein EIK77_000076 [Talaromyces pinophilus]
MKERLRHVVPLSEGWQYAMTDGTDVVWHSARPLPTTIHHDLLSDGTIHDPFPGKNEESVQWVGTKTWMYRTTFKMATELLSNPSSSYVLVFEGLDTFTTIKLDGQIILETTNMFVSYRADISKHVLGQGEQEHVLEITFHNASEKAQEEIQAHPEHNWFSFHFGKLRLATRKAQYHFVRDLSVVFLLTVYDAKITDIGIQTQIYPDHSSAAVVASLDIEGTAARAHVEIEFNGNVVATQDLSLSGQTVTTTIGIPNPKLWWPWTLGQQNMYNMKVTLLSDTSQILDQSQKRFGIRKIVLVQRPVKGQEGTSFFFKVNDVPLFSAGSCWVPTDNILTRPCAQKSRDWVALARMTNQVMIRVWGGGIYEHDAFYDACDELGVLVWQDFMFACGIYPAYESFKDNVMNEVRQNITRLRHHPSIALWCGNNEDYAIAVLGKVEYDPNETDQKALQQSQFPARLYYEVLLPQVCNELTPGIPYWPGSPFGGSYINSDKEGDVHQWYVWHLTKYPYQDYPRLGGRFVTEFGLQSAPSRKAVQQFFPEGATLENRNYTEDEYMVWHNKGRGGQENIEKYMKDNIAVNTTTLAGYIYSTQLVQSEGLSTAYRSWRRDWQGPGKEYCAGALVWQLNDCWPVTSWAIADSELRPKMGYWTVKRENKPITACLARKYNDNELQLEAWACNMTLHEVRAKYQIKAYSVRTGQNVFNHIVEAEIFLGPNRSTELGVVTLGPSEATDFKDIAVGIYLLPASTTTTSGQKLVPSDILARYVSFHEPLKECPLQKELESLIISFDVSRAVIELQAAVPVKGLLLEFDDDGISWDDNGVDLLPGEVIELSVFDWKESAKQVTANWLSEEGWQSVVKKLV